MMRGASYAYAEYSALFASTQLDNFSLSVDDNQLVSLPFSMGGMLSLQELTVSANDLEEIPPSIGLLRHLRYALTS